MRIALAYAARPRLARSSARTTKTKASRHTDNWPAAAVSPMDSQALKIPVVKTSSAKYETVPKSASVSISASAAPAATAGRAIGNATRQKLPHAE